MTIDPALFRDYPDLNVGDRVRYTSAPTIGEHVSGVGTVALIWLGIEEMCDVTNGGHTRTLCRALGDTVEKL